MSVPIAKRKCRACGRVATVAFFIDTCPCGEPYGKLAIGFDQEVVIPDKPLKRRKEVRS